MKILKIALIGSKTVGKTSFTTLLNTGNLEVLNDYNKFYYKVEDNPVNIFKIVEEKEADIIFLMFDLSQKITLNNIEILLKYSKKPIILLGNKSDLITYCPKSEYNNHPIYSKVNEYMQKYKNIIAFHDISVKTFSKITQALDSALCIYNKIKT